MLLPPLLDAARFDDLRGRYEQAWPIALLCCDREGRVLSGEAGGAPPQAATLRLAVEQALHYGDPILLECEGELFCWAVPLTCNQRCLGGLVACCQEAALFGEEGPSVDLRRAMRELRELAESADLTNAALLAGRRQHQERERQRATEIHAAKHGSHRALVSAYLERERALLSAVRAGHRDRARAVLNEVLVAYYHAGAREPELLKSLLLELLVMLGRGAVEVGAPAEAVYGLRFAGVAELVTIEDDERLSAWLTDSLERIFDAVEAARSRDAVGRLREVEQVLAEQCGDEDLDRNAVAEAMGMEAADLGRLLAEEADTTFSELLARTRIERARDLLQESDLSLLQIALEVGFKDPSYFTKVFRRYSGLTPRDYRKMAKG